MRKVIGIGETILDIIFRNNRPHTAVPGGSTFNGLISLGRLGVPVSFISEVGNDHVGDIIRDFMKENNISTRYVDRFPDGKSPISLAFLDNDSNADYTFYKDYPKQRLDVPLPEINEDDIFIYGSYYSLNPALRERMVEFLDYARQRKAILYYDPNFRKAHAHEAIHLAPTLLENFEYADIIRGSDEDFLNIFGEADSEKVYTDHIRFYCDRFITTHGAGGVNLYHGDLRLHFDSPSIRPVSTIGAGDNFNAGILYGLLKNNVRHRDLATLPKETWANIIRCGIDLALLAGCSSGRAPEIRAICLRDDIGNYIIKWETAPHTDGTMKLYVSDTPNSFDMSRPCSYADINDGRVTYITNDNITRKYFLLSFNDKYYRTVGARSVQMDSVQNLRDIGGYFSEHGNRMTGWGKIFRSGELKALSRNDTIRLDNLKIKTVIDLRGEDEIALAPEKYAGANIISIPIPVKGKEQITRRLEEGRIRKGDGLVYMQDTYISYVTDNSEQFGKALKVFLDKDNYPILVNCSMGKDRAGFLTAMLLTALDVPEETIMKDYMASNNHIDLRSLAYMARNLNTDAQETITVLLGANETWLDLAFHKIKKEYGSTDKYLSKGLHLTEKERDTLKDIILN